MLLSSLRCPPPLFVKQVIKSTGSVVSVASSERGVVRDIYSTYDNPATHEIYRQRIQWRIKGHPPSQLDNS